MAPYYLTRLSISSTMIDTFVKLEKLVAYKPKVNGYNAKIYSKPNTESQKVIVVCSMLARIGRHHAVMIK